MPVTFGQVWRKVALQASAVPPLLVRDYVKDAYQRACAGRRWSWLRMNVELQTRASRTLTVTASNGSQLVQGSFVSTDLDRQIRSANSGLPYTITALNVGLTEATLDQVFRGTSGSVEMTILDAFLYMPADFDGCRTLKNLTVQQPMPWWYTQEQLDFWDPNRIWGDTTARIIAAMGTEQRGVTYRGRQVYEWWPYPSGLATYQMSYYRKPDPADDEELQGQLTDRAYAIEGAALAACALYPGTVERKNPYFNMALHDRLEKKFQVDLQELSVRDEDTSPAEEFERIDWRWVQGLVPMDTHLLRSTDATLSDYFGGGYTSGAYNY